MAGKLLKAGLTYTICNVVLRGISFFSIPLFIRLLTPEEFGRYNVFVSIEGVLFVFSALAIHASIKNARYDKKETYDDYIKNCVYVDLFNSLLIAIVANVICLFFSEAIDMGFMEVNLLTLSGFCQAIITIYTSKLIMDYKSGDFVVISFLSVVFGITLSLLFIFTLFDFNHYYGRIWGAVMGQIIAASYALIRIFKDGLAHISISDWKYGLRISLPIVPHGVSQIVLSTANTVMIKYICNAILAGIYSFTYTITLIPQVLFTAISNVWEPWFFENMDKKDYQAISLASTRFCQLISIVFVGMACIVPEMVKVLATEDYYDIMDISIIALIGCYFATLYFIPCEIEYFYKKTEYIAISSVACALLTIILNLCLLTYFSYKIAAYVTLVSYLLYFLFHMLMTYIICHRWMYDMPRLCLIITATCALMMLCFFSIDNYFIRYAVFVIAALYSINIIKKLGFIKFKQHESNL